jgi:hypothetical protein
LAGFQNSLKHFTKKKRRKEYKNLGKNIGIKSEMWTRKTLSLKGEAGSNLTGTRTYARSLKGTRARGTNPLRKDKNVSTITAITKNKVLATANFLGAITGIVFEAFMITNCSLV